MNLLSFLSVCVLAELQVLTSDPKLLNSSIDSVAVLLVPMHSQQNLCDPVNRTEHHFVKVFKRVDPYHTL